MLTSRGRLALVLAAVTYLAAWSFGARALYPPAVGLALAVLAAWAWVWLCAKPVRLHRRVRGSRRFEGDDVSVDLAVDVDGRLPPPPLRVRETLAKLGERTTELDGRRARYLLSALPRGRYTVEDAHAVLEDPFGLARLDVPLACDGAVVVYPRHVELDHVFSERGLRDPGGLRFLLRRSSGFDLHHVREYERGESLRQVHWPTTARRGQLMVKELEDAPRDEVAVVLDGEAVGHSAESFDAAVRVAASLLRANARRGRRSLLLVTGRRRQAAPVASIEGDWDAALDLLASVEPDGTRPVAAVLEEEASGAARALELAVVTSRVTAQLADKLVQRSLAHRRVSLVYVDRASFAGGHELEPALLRVQAAGIPVAVVRAGDDLASVLGGGSAEGAVRAG
jgi:uncharacterized protein (DUF58 family)